MKLHGWKTVSGFLFTVAIAAVGGGSTGSELGCSSSSGDDGSSTSSSGGLADPTGCTTDDSLDCSGGGTGFACATGDNPESEDSTYNCSDPQSSAGEDDYCCFTGGTFAPGTCASDDDLTAVCTDADSYGFQCASGDDPTSEDPDIDQCSTATPDADGIHDDFCCTLTGGTSSSSGSGSSGGDDSSFGTGCVADDGLDCSGGGTGISCPGGTTPDDSAGICSDPSSMSDGSDGFCCITITDTGCSQDDSVTGGCDYPSYGFSCTTGSPDPSADDSSLTCSTATSDPNGNDDYCCVDN